MTLTTAHVGCPYFAGGTHDTFVEGFAILTKNLLLDTTTASTLTIRYKATVAGVETNYVSITVASDGGTTITTSGTDADFEIATGTTGDIILDATGDIILEAGGGDISIDSELTITSTTNPQLVVKYDAGDYVSLGVADGGAVILAVTGAVSGSLEFTTDDGAIIVDSAGEITLEPATEVDATLTLTSQTAENQLVDINFSTDSTFLAGSNLTYSGGRGSAALNVSATKTTNVTGGLHGIYVLTTDSTDTSTDGNGVIGLKVYTLTDSTNVTDGERYGAQFITKYATTGTALAAASFIGVEGWFYETGATEIRTGIGGNFGWHADSTAGSHAAGSVWRGIQIFTDNGGTSDAEETTGLYVWSMAGTLDNGVVIGAGTFTTGINFLAGSTITTGIAIASVAATDGIVISCTDLITSGITISAGGTYTGITMTGANIVTGINIDACTMALDADVTLVAATNAVNINVTSTAAQASGYNQVLQLTLTHSGDLTGGECHVAAIDAIVSGDCPYLYLQTYYLETSGNPTIGQFAAISIYAANAGTAVTEYTLVDLGIDQSGGDPADRFCYIRMRSHNGTYMPKVAIMLEGAGGAENLFSWDVAQNMLTAGSDSANCDYKVAVQIGTNTRYLHLFTD